MRLTLLFALFILPLIVEAQDNLLDELKAERDTLNASVIQTFKGTRIVSGHSVETRDAGILEFIISHRFGTLNSGSYNLWGLDFSTIRLGLEYSITDKLTTGVGRSSLDKTYDGFVKYKAFQQSAQSFPLTVTLLGGVAYKALKGGAAAELANTDRLSYNVQVIMARKLSRALSIQVSPMLLHRNGVEQAIAVNDLVVLGLGGRLRVTRSLALNAEYHWRLNEHENSPFQDALGLGVEIETGGHVFHLIFTNSLGMTERIIAAETSGDFFDGDVHFGFNITRAFQLSKR